MKMQTFTFVKVVGNQTVGRIARFWKVQLDVRNRRVTTIAGRACTDGARTVVTVKTCQGTRDLAFRRMAEQRRRGYVLVFQG